MGYLKDGHYTMSFLGGIDKLIFFFKRPMGVKGGGGRSGPGVDVKIEFF